MADEHSTTAERLAIVCEHLEEIRKDLRNRPGGDDSPLERVLTAARNGRDLADPLALLHQALHTANRDPHGLNGYADTGGSPRGLRPAGTDDPPTEWVYRCPAASRCARSCWPQATAAAPGCTISGHDLRLERL